MFGGAVRCTPPPRLILQEFENQENLVLHRIETEPCKVCS